MSAGALPQTHWGSLQRSPVPRPSSWFQGGRFAAGRNGGEGRERLGRGEDGKGGEKGNEGGREKGEVGGNCAFVVGG